MPNEPQAEQVEKSIVPYAPIFVDASPRVVWMAVRSLFTQTPREEIAGELQRRFRPLTATHETTLATLCVRSALDIYLSVRSFPKGSRLLMTAINIPDVSRVIRSHGLIPVPVDVDVDTMAPDLDALRTALDTPPSAEFGEIVAVMVAHVYSRRFDMNPTISLIRGAQAEVGFRGHIDVLEDCAEAFVGPEWTGHPGADLAFFSFGAIKIGTAFGGGLVRVKDEALLECMRTFQQSFPVQTRLEYLKKIVKYSVVTFFTNFTPVTRIGMNATRAAGVDPKPLFVSLLRGFPDAATMLRKLRHAPSAPLLAVLLYRMAKFSQKDLEQTKVVGDLMISLLPDGVQAPGLQASVRRYWLFPIVVAHPEEIISELNNWGVDAYRGATQLDCVPVPDEMTSVCARPDKSADLMAHTIYLPIDRRVPPKEVRRVAQKLRHVVKMVARRHELSESPQSRL